MSDAISPRPFIRAKFNPEKEPDNLETQIQQLIQQTNLRTDGLEFTRGTDQLQQTKAQLNNVIGGEIERFENELMKLPGFIVFDGRVSDRYTTDDDGKLVERQRTSGTKNNTTHSL